MVTISVTAARCVAWRCVASDSQLVTIARHATPRNATRSRNGNNP